MVNAYVEDSETDQVSVDEFAGTELRWSRKGILFITMPRTTIYATSLNITTRFSIKKSIS